MGAEMYFSHPRFAERNARKELVLLTSGSYMGMSVCNEKNMCYAWLLTSPSR